MLVPYARRPPRRLFSGMQCAQRSEHMLASTNLVLDVLVEHVAMTLMDTWRPLRVLGHSVDSMSLTLQELLMLALVALAADGVTEWLTGRRITRLLVGIVIAALGSVLLLTLLLTLLRT